MEQETIMAAMKRLEKYVYTLPRAKDLNLLAGDRRQAMIALRDRVSAARTSIAVYVASDDSTEQAVALEEGIEHITAANDAIMVASQHDLLGPADVAQLSSLAEHIKERLR